jgi:streptogramin lyase
MSCTVRDPRWSISWATLASVLALVVGIALSPAISQAATPTITEFGVTTSGAFPFDIAAGPDGNLWFTERDASKVARITPAGVITEFPISFLSGPLGIAPDGMIFFTEPGVDQIGRIDPFTTAITEFAGITLGSNPVGITAGADGNLWFTESGGVGKIGRMTPTGVITEFNIPTLFSNPQGITNGPDGNLWFAETDAFQIGRFNPITLIFTEFGLGSITGGPNGITTGPDGNLWFTEPATNLIGRMTPSGSLTGEFGGITPGSFPLGITGGADGNLWFTEEFGNQIGRITLAGAVSEFPLPTFGTFSNGITAGADCNVWFTEPDANQIGRVNLGLLRINGACEPPPGPAPDRDADGIQDTLDNCVSIFNPDQQDTDADHVGDACDNCLNDFNFEQSDGSGSGSGDMCDSGTPTPFTLKHVRLKADTRKAATASSGNGTILVNGVLDTTEMGGVEGLREALQSPFAVGLTGAGLAAPGESIFFPRCRSMIACSGTGPESASFVRRGVTNLFSVKIRAQNRSFKPALSSAPVTVTLSVGVDRRDQISCSVLGNRGQIATCR